MVAMTDISKATEHPTLKGRDNCQYDWYYVFIKKKPSDTNCIIPQTAILETMNVKHIFSYACLR